MKKLILLSVFVFIVASAFLVVDVESDTFPPYDSTPVMVVSTTVPVHVYLSTPVMVVSTAVVGYAEFPTPSMGLSKQGKQE